MNNILHPNTSFDFTKLSLAQPIAIQGGAYCTKLLYDNTPIYIQAPKSITKQGFVKTGKKIYCDLMFDNGDEEFINWIEGLETKCQQMIFEKSGDWFQNPLELNDIESAFNSPLKVYKSGKFYLVRSNIKINSLTSQPLIKIYNENESPLLMDDINNETNIISILEIQGVKFTSRNFQIDIELKQVMVLNQDEIFETCLIKNSNMVSNNRTMPITLNTNIEASEVSEVSEASEVPETCDIKSNLKLLNLNECTELNDNIIDTTSSSVKNLELELDNILDINHNDTTILRENENVKVKIDNDNIEKINDVIDDNSHSSEINENDLVDSILEKLEEPTNELSEYNIDIHLDNSDVFELRKPDKVYYEMYQKIREKAKNAKQEAIAAYLEAKNIKKTYLLEELSDSSEESMSNISDTDIEDAQLYA